MKSEDMRYEDAFDHIMRHFKDENRYPLSDSLRGRLDRWRAAYDWILTYKPLTDSAAVKFLMGMYQVTEPQAWRDIRDCKRFFGNMEKAHRDFERIMLIAQIRDLRAKAEAKGQFKVAAQCDATLAKLEITIKDDQEGENQNTGKNIELLIGFNPKLVGAKEIPNLLEQVEKFIGEKAKQELMIEDWIDSDGNRLG